MVVVDAIALQSMEDAAIHASSENEPNNDRDIYETYQQETHPVPQPSTSLWFARHGEPEWYSDIHLVEGHKQISLVTEFTSALLPSWL